MIGRLLILGLVFAATVANGAPKTLAEWTRVVAAEELDWRMGGDGGRGSYEAMLEADGSKEAALKLGVFYLKLEDARLENRLLAWRWFRVAGGDADPLTQLARGYVLLAIGKAFGGESHLSEVERALESMGDPAVQALVAAIEASPDPVLRRRAASVLYRIRRGRGERP